MMTRTFRKQQAPLVQFHSDWPLTSKGAPCAGKEADLWPDRHTNYSGIAAFQAKATIFFG